MRQSIAAEIGSIALLVCGAAQAAEVTFEQRVQADQAIEAVRLAHRSAGTARIGDRGVFERRVRARLAESIALETFWNTPLTPAMLEAELQHMIERSRMPARLREYFAALGDDPLLIEEALVRPALVHRLTRSRFAQDWRIHGRARAEAAEIRDALAAGRIDPSRDDPRRFVADRAEAVGIVGQNADSFYVDAALTSPDGRARVARYVVHKVSWDDWWSKLAPSIDPRRAATVSRGAVSPVLAAFLAQELSGGGKCDGKWANASLDDVPDPRRFSRAVWTGSEMLVFGGYNGTTALASGGRYDPAIDRWEALTDVGAPVQRYSHTAVWTGTRMIIWGGFTIPGGAPTNSGALYDPVADAWSPLSAAGAPSPRRKHTAVWTGTEMIVWGGSAAGQLGSGGRYDPATDTWTPTSNTGAPTGRDGHTAVSTGSRMIVWGGASDSSGGVYDPATDTWTATTLAGAPPATEGHTAVWTGTRMIVWGGNDLKGKGGVVNTGGIYDPASNTWSPIPVAGAPDARRSHVAVWTGDRMVVWGGGGCCGPLNSGASYRPSSGTWIPMTTNGAPEARDGAVAVSTGSEMIVWSGTGLRDTNTGGRYDPVANGWTPTSVGDAPSPRSGHTTVWTGSEMIAWGGSAGSALDSGGRYDPATDAWVATSMAQAPAPRSQHTAVWTGTEMIVWGGMSLGTNTGGRYDPLSDTWTATPLSGAPSPRSRHTAVWSGTEMIVWGGFSTSPTFLDTGGRYHPGTGTWTETSTAGAPYPRNQHSAVWTGAEMIVWGGISEFGYQQTGGRYDPVADGWTPTSVGDAPSPRSTHTTVWTGSEMIVWGGSGGPALGSGGRYHPTTDAWVATSMAQAPAPRTQHSAVWTGSEMLVWGGRVPGQSGLPDHFPRDGGRYDPATDAWEELAAAGAPTGRYLSRAVWTGDEMVVWGGNTGALSQVASGGRFSITSRPGEARGVQWSDAGTLSWLEPAAPGGVTPRYDVIRSPDPGDFIGAGTCVASDVLATTAPDPTVPPQGGVLFYLVRAENGCGQGQLGSASDGTPRQAGACPPP